jgi:hypothetical protein
MPRIFLKEGTFFEDEVAFSKKSALKMALIGTYFLKMKRRCIV